MNKEVQIIISAKDAASKVVRGISNTVDGFAKTAKSQMDRVTRSVNQIADSARALTVPFSVASGAAVAMGDQFVELAFRAETGTNIFNKMLARVGENQDQVAKQVEELSEVLRVPPQIIEQNAKDLLRKGYTFSQIADIYQGAVASGLTIGRDSISSIQSVNEALVSEMSIQLNRIGIAENLSTAYQDYAESLGKTKDQLTEAEKAAAAHLMIQKATAAEVEDLPELFKGYGGAVASLGEEWYETRRIIGDELMPVWTQFKQGAADLLGTFNELDDEQRDVIFGIGKVAAKAVAAAAGIGLIASAASLAGKAFGLLSGIATLVLNPLILGGVAIAAIGTALYTAWDQDWGGVKTAITNFVNGALEKWEEFKSWQGWDTLEEYGKNLASWLGDLWSNVKTGDWEAAWQQVVDALQASWETLSTWEGWGKIWTWIVDAAIVTWDWLKNAWNSLSSWEGWGNIWNWVVNTAKITWDFVKDSWNKLKDWEGWGNIVDWIDEKTPDSIKVGVNTAGDVVNAVLKWSMEYAENVGQDIRDGLETGDWSGLISKIRNASQVALGVTFAAKTITAFAASIASKLKTQAGFAAATGTGAIAAITLGLKLAEEIAGGEDIIDDIINALGGAAAGFALGGPTGAMIGLTIAVEFEVFSNAAKKVHEWLKPVREMIGSELNQEYIDIMTGSIQPPESETFLVAPEGQNIWQQFIDSYKRVWVNPTMNWMDGGNRQTWLDVLLNLFKNQYAAGGKVTGPGTGKSDSIPALLSNGEFVVNAEATKKWLPLLEAINNGVIGFKTGGLVGFANGGLFSGLTGNLNIDIANVSGFISDISSNINKLFSDVVKVFTATFEFIGELLIELAKKIFGEDKVNSALEVLNKFKTTIENILKGDGGTDDPYAMFKDPRRPLAIGVRFGDIVEKTATWLDIFREKLKETALRLGDKLLQQLPIADSVISGFKQNGLWGAFEALISQSKVFATIVEMVNPILQELANIAGAVLLPVLKILEPPLKLLAKVLRWVAEVIIKVWNTIVDILDTIIFWDDLSDWKASLDDLTDSTKEANKQMQEAARNVPTGFKITTARWNATQAVDVNERDILAAILEAIRDQQPLYINNVYGWEDFKRKVKEATSQNKRHSNMSTYGLRTGGM